MDVSHSRIHIGGYTFPLKLHVGGSAFYPHHLKFCYIVNFLGTYAWGVRIEYQIFDFVASYTLCGLRIYFPIGKRIRPCPQILNFLNLKLLKGMGLCSD